MAELLLQRFHAKEIMEDRFMYSMELVCVPSLYVVDVDLIFITDVGIANSSSTRCLPHGSEA